MLHPTIQKPLWLGKLGSVWGPEKPEQVAWLGLVSADSQAIAALSLSFGREDARLSRAGGCASILSPCD